MWCATKARLLQALLRELAPRSPPSPQYRQAINDFFATLPTAEIARSLPVGKSGTTVPTIWARAWAITVTAGTPFRSLQSYAGSVPRPSAAARPADQFRFACNPVLRDALHQFAFLSPVP